MKLTFLGTGTSHGIPVIACDCPVCHSKDPKNKRYRASVYVQTSDDKHILVDCGPEFRLQAVENNVRKIDAILLTHSHADHLHGIDDIRIFSCDCFKRTDRNARLLDAPPLPIYTNASTLKDVRSRFSYFFHHSKEGGGHAKVELYEVKEPLKIGNATITPIPMMHGHLETAGWLFREGKSSIAYLTDCSYISSKSIKLLQDASGITDGSGHIEHLIIDGLRVREHSTHCNFDQAIEYAAKIGGNNVWMTHLTHEHSHDDADKYLQEKKPKEMKVHPAWDGLVIEG